MGVKADKAREAPRGPNAADPPNHRPCTEAKRPDGTGERVATIARYVRTILTGSRGRKGVLAPLSWRCDRLANQGTEAGYKPASDRV